MFSVRIALFLIFWHNLQLVEGGQYLVEVEVLDEGNDHLTWRGGYGFFSKKIFWFPIFPEKNILILVEEKKKSDSECLPYNLMLNSGKKFLTLVLSEKKISERNKKP